MPPQRREELLLEFERSGLPATKFAQLAGVRYQTFATWVQKHKKRRPLTGKKDARHLVVEIATVFSTI